MIPDWVYVVGSVALLVIPPVLQARRINRERDEARDNAHAIEVERRARENAYPLGNADRFYG